MVYKVSYSTAWATHRNPLSKKTKLKKKRERERRGYLFNMVKILARAIQKEKETKKEELKLSMHIDEMILNKKKPKWTNQKFVETDNYIQEF